MGGEGRPPLCPSSDSSAAVYSARSCPRRARLRLCGRGDREAAGGGPAALEAEPPLPPRRGGLVARLPPRREAGRLCTARPPACVGVSLRGVVWSRNRRGGGKRKTRRGSFPWPRKEKRSLAAPLLSPRFFVSRFTPPKERSGPHPKGAPPRPAAQPREQRSDRPAVPSLEDAPGTTPGT